VTANPAADDQGGPGTGDDAGHRPLTGEDTGHRPRTAEDPGYPAVAHTTPGRHRERIRYDRDTVHAVLDEALICSVGFVSDGRPVVLPTLHVRSWETVYLHGSTGSWLRRVAVEGGEVCVSATVVDALVLARSAFHHSMNYRSVVLFGRPREVVDRAEKRASLAALVDHVLPGRSDEVRGPNPRELAATIVLALDLAEVSAKVRSGPPVDDEEDQIAPTWAGVVPVRSGLGEPFPARELPTGMALPPSLAGLIAP